MLYFYEQPFVVNPGIMNVILCEISFSPVFVVFRVLGNNNVTYTVLSHIGISNAVITFRCPHGKAVILEH